MRIVQRLAVWTVAIAALMSATPARAQTADAIDRLVGRPVTAIRLEVEGRRSEAPDLLALIEVPRGEPLDLARLRASLMQLYSAGRFDDIRVRGVASETGIELIFELVPRHPVDRVAFAGLRGVPPGDLEKELRQRFAGLPRGSQADAAARTIERVLAERGYRQAKVQSSLDVTHLPDRATLLLTVDMGPLTIVTSAKIDGASPLSAPEVLKRAGVVVGEAYRSRDIDLGLDKIIEDLRARGYYDASVSHARDVISADGRSVDVIITVESAVPIVLKFEGDPLPGKDSVLVPIKREGSADDDLLEDSVRRIEAALRAEGYWKGHASFAHTVTPAGRVITITVTRGARYRFEKLEVSGNTQMATEAISALIALEPLDLFDESKVARGVAAIRDAYLLKGYAAATITATAEPLPPARAGGDPRVIERLVVDEGKQTTVGDVRVSGATNVATADVLGAMRLKRTGPYVAGFVPGDRDAIRQLYDERGYGAAVVDVRSTLNAERTSAVIQVDVIAEGPQTLLDHVIIAGNRRISEAQIRSAVALTPGQPLGASARIALQQRLSAMGVFRRVIITEAPHPGGEAGTDLIITVDESPTTTLVYGGGIEIARRARTVADGDQGETKTVDRIESAVRGSGEVGRTNLGGKNRSVNLAAGVSLRPIDDAGNPDRDGKCCAFSEYRVVGSMREQHLFGWNVDGLTSIAAEQAIRNSFDFRRQNVGVQILRKLPARTSLINGYSLERVELYNVRIAPEDQLAVDRLFPQVRLSVLSTSVIHDTRSDPISPNAGGLLSTDGELALRALGSEVGYAKVFLQGFAYRRLPSAPRVVLAGAARVGFVRGFEQAVEGETIEPVPASKRFFSGGSSTVRGFQQDRLGAPDVIDTNGQSNGGNGLIVLNAEARTSIKRDIDLATFIDTGNVFSRVGLMDLSQLRSSIGAGVRYRSPIGPLRFDVAWKLGELRQGDIRRWEFHFSIGEAF